MTNPAISALRRCVSGAIERGQAEPILGFEIVETIDDRWMILVNGFQWGEPPFDASGCSSQTWETKELALAAWHDQLSF
jgi:hypothetical protein